MTKPTRPDQRPSRVNEAHIHDNTTTTRLTSTVHEDVHSGHNRVINSNEHTSTKITTSESAIVAHVVRTAHPHALHTNHRTYVTPSCSK